MTDIKKVGIEFLVLGPIGDKQKRVIAKEHMVDIDFYRDDGYSIEYLDQSNDISKTYNFIINEGNKKILDFIEFSKGDIRNIKKITDGYNFDHLKNSVLVVNDDVIEKVYVGVNVGIRGDVEVM